MSRPIFRTFFVFSFLLGGLFLMSKNTAFAGAYSLQEELRLFSPGWLSLYSTIEKVYTARLEQLRASEVVEPVRPLPAPPLPVPIKNPTASLDGKKYIALTFDDGPNPKTTPRLLDILSEKGVHATFYVLGINVEKYGDIVRREVEEGHEMGDHSWGHWRLTTIPAADALNEIVSTSKKIEEVSGVAPATLRPPYGSYNDALKALSPIPLVTWSVETLDWKNRDATRNLETTLPQVRDGSIILFHDIYDASVDTIAPLIDKLREEGYEFVTVSELYQKYRGSGAIMPQGVICFSAYTCR